MPTRPVVIFMTSNGVGMGHLSRQLTTIISDEHRIKPVLFSLSGALPRIARSHSAGELPELHGSGIRYEYCPSRESLHLPAKGWRRKFRVFYRSYRWHPYLRDRLVALVEEVGARAVVFDGVVPYSGLLKARKRLPGVHFIWVRRGMWQKATPEHRLNLSKNFDLTIEPGDFAAAYDEGPTQQRNDAAKIAPISLTDVLIASTKNDARASLGLPTTGRILLLAPGSGALGSVKNTIDAIRELVETHHSSWCIALTRQAIARHDIKPGRNLYVLEDVYPLARYLKAFDAAIGAAGYNSVHELLSARVPTLLVPSLNHATDDQRARAEGVAALGAALISRGNLETETADLLSDTVRFELRTACARLPSASGGREAAELIYEQARNACDYSKGRRPRAPKRPIIETRASIKRGDISDVLFTENVPENFLNEPIPVEHIISNSSTSYRKERQRIADWLYSFDS